MSTFLLAIFTASLVGSLHCVGMCGGVVAMCAAGPAPVAGERRGRGLLPTYHVGRLATYAGLGAVSGLIGRGIDVGGGAIGWSRAAAILAGGTMIVIAGAALWRSTGRSLGIACLHPPAWMQRVLQRGMRAAMDLPPRRRAAVVGVLTGFLPCGWLYAFVVAAASTGGALSGAAVMTAFWLGTVPALIAVGVGVRLVGVPLRRYVPRASAIAMLVLGAVAITGRLTVPAYASIVEERAAAGDVVPDTDEAPACCAARGAQADAEAEAAREPAPGD